MPSSLYRYQTLSHFSLASLLNNTLWLSDPALFNDPFDCLFTVVSAPEKERLFLLGEVWTAALNEGLVTLPAHAASGLFRIDSRGNIIVEVRARAQAEGEDQIIGNAFAAVRGVGVTCFSEVSDSILMWSHYANHHRGFCIEYETESIDTDAVALFPVEYVDNFPAVSPGDFSVDARRSTLRRLWLAKSTCWKYEKEWRLLAQGQRTNIVCPLPARRVIFGARMEQSERRAIQRALRFIPHLKYAGARLHPEVFALEFYDVPRDEAA